MTLTAQCTSYRPVLSSERTPYKKNNKAFVTKERIRIKSGHRSQRESRYQDELVDWPTAVRQTQLNSITRLGICSKYPSVEIAAPAKQYKAKIKCNNEPVHFILSVYSFVTNVTAVLSFPCQNSEHVRFSFIPAAMFKPQ
jgi:hypothetical protein